MSDLKKEVGEYFSSRDKIFEVFEEDGFEGIDDLRDNRWTADEYGGFQYLNSSGEEYGFDSARQCGETVDGLNLFYVQDNGEAFYTLFSQSLKRTEDEYEEEIGKEI